ncbi:hypothetical protein AYJ02_14185 [Shewanella algae]|nr:hypothetical protein AYJ02_14185 [Shewanella algae]
MFRNQKGCSVTPEFTLEAASLVLDLEYSIPEAYHSLYIGETVLRHWVSQLEDERGGTTLVSESLTPAQQKDQELEASLNHLE